MVGVAVLRFEAETVLVSQRRTALKVCMDDRQSSSNPTSQSRNDVCNHTTNYCLATITCPLSGQYQSQLPSTITLTSASSRKNSHSRIAGIR